MTSASLDRMVAKTGKPREKLLEAILKQNPQGRLITPEEVAHVVVSLCDEKAGGISGQAIVIDGGALPV